MGGPDNRRYRMGRAFVRPSQLEVVGIW